MRRLELIFLLSASGVGYSPSAAARRDGAIAEATECGRTASALNIIGGQRKACGELVGERQREAGALLAALKTERASVAAMLAEELQVAGVVRGGEHLQKQAAGQRR
jgi:hypothetical protein